MAPIPGTHWGHMLMRQLVGGGRPRARLSPREKPWAHSLIPPTPHPRAATSQDPGEGCPGLRPPWRQVSNATGMQICALKSFSLVLLGERAVHSDTLAKLIRHVNWHCRSGDRATGDNLEECCLPSFCLLGTGVLTA